jgi:hypothetical protein
MMPKTKEYYNFVGKFYIASAPIQVTRFPPPKISDEDNSEFWEKERLKLWDELDPKTRAEFTWPSKGEMPKAEDIAFSCQSLTKTSNVVHDIARDNFCLLVYKVTQVEYFNYNTFPQQRLVSYIYIYIYIYIFKYTSSLNGPFIFFPFN